MNQSFYGLLLFIFLVMPPVAQFMESVMVIHMHMQMPLLVIAGMLMARFFQLKFPAFFEKWNERGIPGILLFVLIMGYWMLPRTMDEALTLWTVEGFKFISLPFLAGIALRDSWKKLNSKGKNGVIIVFAILFLALGWLYTGSPIQLCNNYLVIEQITLGWAFILTAICMIIYLTYSFFVNPSDYQ